MSKLSRKTKETEIDVEVSLGGESRIATPVKFLDHMLGAFAKHGGFGLRVAARSKDEDEHHLVEDVAITLGGAFRQMRETGPVKRFGHEALPMDDALVAVYLDAGGRGYYAGKLPNVMYEHFLRSFAHEAGITLHVDVMRGRDEHHVTEAVFKALGRALRRGLEPASEVQSTKGEAKSRGG